MIRFVIVLEGVEAIGPFDTRKEAVEYVKTDWQGSAMQIMELIPAAESDEDKPGITEDWCDR